MNIRLTQTRDWQALKSIRLAAQLQAPTDLASHLQIRVQTMIWEDRDRTDA